jgi:paraquat-inducible protein B
MNVSIGADGIIMRTESVQSLLYGGIAFETPETLERVKEDVEGLVFTLYDSLESIHEESFTKKITFILFFDGSVRGLTVGAPVEFKGIKVGSVKDVRLEFDKRDTSFRIPVLIEIAPERVIARGQDEDTSPYETLKNLVDRGLRARLQTGSLLTGQLFVELDMHPGTPIRLVNEEVPFPELPTIPAELEQMTTSVKSILAKLEKVEMEKIGAELLGSLQGANQLINNPELRDSANDLKESLIAFKSILRKLDQRVEPITVNLEKAIGAGHQALEETRVTLGLIDEVLKPDSPIQYNFGQLTEELAETARSIRILVDLLERNPNAIIFGKDSPGEK